MNWFSKTVPAVEADVHNFLLKIETGVQTAEADAQKALQWVAQKTPDIVAGLQALESFVVAVPGMAVNPSVMAGVAAANLAVAGLNAFAKIETAPNATIVDQAKAVVAGYQAVNNARVAMATANNVAVGATAVVNK
jgi:hypothetical protein